MFEPNAIFSSNLQLYHMSASIAWWYLPSHRVYRLESTGINWFVSFASHKRGKAAYEAQMNVLDKCMHARKMLWIVLRCTTSVSWPNHNYSFIVLSSELHAESVYSFGSGIFANRMCHRWFRSPLDSSATKFPKQNAHNLRTTNAMQFTCFMCTNEFQICSWHHVTTSQKKLVPLHIMHGQQHVSVALLFSVFPAIFCAKLNIRAGLPSGWGFLRNFVLFANTI